MAEIETDMDVIVVGGGLNGPALALALASVGLRIALIDAAPAEARAAADFDGRAYALSLASQRMLSALGLWADVAGHAQAIAEIKITDGRPGEGPAPLFLHFHGAEIDEGPMGHIVEDRHLRAALRARTERAPGIFLIDGARVTAQSVTPGGICVTLEDGRTLRARLLAGCDGRASGVARRAGIARTEWGYGQTAMVCALAHERPHHGIAHQFFLPPGPLAILPLPGERASIVWTERSDVAETVSGYDAERYFAYLRPRFGDFLGPLSLAGKRYAYPLGLSLAERFIDERVALVGDAAHGIHPIAGQGLNLGLRDVAALAEVLTDARRRGQDIGAPDVLALYQRWRRFDTAALALATDGLNRLFSNDNPFLRAGRDLGLGLVGTLPGLRRGLIRAAAGISGDLPRLLRGRPL